MPGSAGSMSARWRPIPGARPGGTVQVVDQGRSRPVTVVADLLHGPRWLEPDHCSQGGIDVLALPVALRCVVRCRVGQTVSLVNRQGVGCRSCARRSPRSALSRGADSTRLDERRRRSRQTEETRTFHPVRLCRVVWDATARGAGLDALRRPAAVSGATPASPGRASRRRPTSTSGDNRPASTSAAWPSDPRKGLATADGGRVAASGLTPSGAPRVVRGAVRQSKGRAVVPYETSAGPHRVPTGAWRSPVDGRLEQLAAGAVARQPV